MALTLWRPWTYCILHLGKDVENRSRQDGRRPGLCTYRGWLLLHAGKRWDPNVRAFMRERSIDVPLRESHRLDPLLYDDANPSGIVGRVRVIGHIEPGERVRALVMGDPKGSWLRSKHVADDPSKIILADSHKSLAAAREVDLRWWTGDYGLVLAEPEPLAEPIPCRGRQQLWRPSGETYAQLPDGWDRRTP